MTQDYLENIITFAQLTNICYLCKAKLDFGGEIVKITIKNDEGACYAFQPEPADHPMTYADLNAVCNFCKSEMDEGIRLVKITIEDKEGICYSFPEDFNLDNINS